MYNNKKNLYGARYIASCNLCFGNFLNKLLTFIWNYGSDNAAM